MSQISRDDIQALIRGKIMGGILDALAFYRYLTIGQMEALGIGNERWIRQRLQDLETAKLVYRQTFDFGPSIGKLPHAFWLTPKGAKIVAEGNNSSTYAPTRFELSPTGAKHRMLTVDSLIAAKRWAGDVALQSFTFGSYFDRKGAFKTDIVLKSQSRSMIADVILDTEADDDTRRVFVLEVYTDGSSHGHSKKQLEAYIKAGQTSELDQALGLTSSDKAAGILVVFDTVKYRDATIKALKGLKDAPKQSHPSWARYRFKAKEDLRDFGNGWLNIHGERVSLPTNSLQAPAKTA